MEKLYLTEKRYSIIHGQNGAEAEIFAAEELAAYLQKITGIMFPIQTDAAADTETEIVIGQTNRQNIPDTAGLGEDGFIIRTVGEKLYLTGGGLRGTLFAVYEFLEACLGCRFYSSDFEKIPHLDTIELDPIDDRQVPVFTVRDNFWADYNHHKDFAFKRKMNGKKGPSLPLKYGGSMAWAGSSCHTIGALSEMTGDHTDRQPCLCDETVYETVLKNVRKALAENPDARFISVSQNDSHDWGVGCQCEKCMQIYRETGSYAGSFLQFVNRIADDIREDYPNVMIHTFAYRYTRKAPKGVVPRPNVMVELCSIEACFRHPLAECTTVGKEHESADDFAVLIRDWAAICQNLSVWDYTTDFANYNLTFPNLGVLRDNMRLFADNNVKYVFEQGAYQTRNGEFGELRGYLLAKLLWDPYMSEETYNRLVDEFLVDYYGAGGEHIRQYIELALAETAHRHVSIYISAEDLYPNHIIENHAPDTIPDELTAEKILAGKVDLESYTEWYTSVKPHIVLEKGMEYFEAARAAAEDPFILRNIERSMVQVEVLRTYWQYRVLENRRENLQKILTAVLEEETAAAQICNTVCKNDEDAYAAENRKLMEKMLEMELYCVTEGMNIRRKDSFRFDLPVTWW